METREQLIDEIKCRIKNGKDLNDSKLWYVSDNAVDGLFEAEEDEDYKKVIIPTITQDMLGIAKYIAENYKDKDKIILTDWGSGNGKISKIITQDLIKRGFDVTYMPIDISQKELDTAIAEHKGEKVKPVVCLFENLHTIFPLQVKKDTVVIHCFLGNTIGNFDKSINDIIKSVKEDVIIHMPLNQLKTQKDKENIIAGYVNQAMQKMVLSVFKLIGLSSENFTLNKDTGFRYGVVLENGIVKTFVTLAKDL